MHRPEPAIVAVLVVATAAVYAQTAGFQFVNYDDPLYVTGNPIVRRGLTADGVAWALTTGAAQNWHPVTWLSHMLDVTLFGVRPGAHHLVNVAWHVANTVLCFAVFRALTGAVWPSAFVAAVLALHPAHVESVAWISERKDVVSTFCFLLVVGAYARWVRKRSIASYLVVALALAVGLMAKPMLVTAPCVLLLLDVWPLRRVALDGDGLRRLPGLVWEKLPLLALAAASAVMTFLAQRAGGAVAEVSLLPMATRLANATVAYARYLATFVWPADLGLIYPLVIPVPVAQVVGAAALLAAITGLVVWQARRRPWLLVGWLWFVGTLVPVIGIVQVGEQAMADRYTYLPFFGLAILVAFGAAELGRARPALAVAGGVVVVAWAVLTARQAAYWQRSETILARTLAVTSDNYHAYYGMAEALVADGRPLEAMPHLREAVRIWPEYADAHLLLAQLASQAGESELAIASWEAALTTRPGNAGAEVALGTELAGQQRFAEAAPHLARAVELDPEAPSARFNLALVLLAQGEAPRGVAQLRAALRLRPGWPPATNRLAWVLATSADAAVRRPDEAVQLAEGLARETPTADALDTLAAAYAAAGRFPEAIRTAEAALAAARDAGEPEVAEVVETRLARYRRGEPFTE
ncbi:MAG: tetratricopeptide repeat protein [bacterium]|nr:tetratricopeptide repeat protein [bacterium]